jgi:hypothetical protein
MSTGKVTVTTDSSQMGVTLDSAVHPSEKGIVVIPTMLGTEANVNVYVKSQSNSTGEWVITFGLSAAAMSATGYEISYIAYSSTV